MTNYVRTVVTLGAAASVLVFSGLVSALPQTADEIVECVRSNFPTATSNQLIEIRSVDRIGGERSLKGQMLWKPSRNGESRITLNVNAPADLAGASFLVIERGERDDIFMYLPSMGRVRRMQGSSVQGKLWGTDFSYADIKQLQGISTGNSSLLEDSEFEGRPVWRLQLLPAVVDDTGFSKFISSIDKSNCMMLKTEIFRDGEEPDKVLVSNPEAIKKVGGFWTAHDFRITDVANATHSTLMIHAVSHETKIDEGAFKRQTFHSTHVSPPASE